MESHQMPVLLAEQLWEIDFKFSHENKPAVRLAPNLNYLCNV